MVMMYGKRKHDGYKYPQARHIPKFPRYKKVSNARSGGFVGRELKFVDYALTNTTVGITLATADQDPALALCLNAVAQGTGNSQRLGLRAIFKSLDIRMNFIWQQVVKDGATARVIVYIDKQTNGAQAQVTDLLDGAKVAAENAILAPLNLENKHRFQILRDVAVQSPTSDVNWDGTVFFSKKQRTQLHLKIPLGGKRGLQTRFLGTGATVADVADNSVHIAIFMNQSSTGGVLASYISRARFYAD